MKLRTFFLLTATLALIATSCRKNNTSSVIFRVSPQTLTLESAGGTGTLSVVTTGEWSVSGNSYFKLEPVSGKGPGTVSVKAPANTLDNAVEETVIFSSGEKTVTITLIQKGAGVPEDEISVSPTSLDFDEQAGSKDIVVTASGQWNWTCDADWISVTGNESGVSVSVRENGGEARSAAISFNCGTKTATVTVNQAKASGPLTKIKSADDFLTFISILKEYPEGTVIEFVNDIDFSGVTNIPFVEIPATVTLDGKGFAIKNWTNGGIPLFKANNGIIRNLVIDSSCKITYDITLGNKTQFGILLGQNYNLVKDCTNKASINFPEFEITSTTHWGMFIGINRNVIEGCVNEGNVTIGSLTGGGELRLGGFAGSLAENANTTTLVIKNCINRGNLTITRGDVQDKNNSIGGIGGILDSNDDAIIEGCVNEGAITFNAPDGTKKAYVGGIIGNFRGGKIRESRNFGKISSNALGAFGGIAGSLYINTKVSEFSTMEGCAVNAEISGDGKCAGLVFGKAITAAKFNLGTADSPIKVAGKVNGTVASSGNFSGLLCGSDTSIGEGCSVNAKFETVNK